MEYIERYKLKKDVNRWQWAYWTGYVNALYCCVSAFMFKDGRGHYSVGFEPVYSISMIAVGGAVGLIARGIHKKVSIGCMVALFLLCLWSTISMSRDVDNPRDVMHSVIATILYLRGTIGVWNLKRAWRQEGKEGTPLR